MPSTVTQTRPDQATGLRHISDPANAMVAKINATRAPNVVKMHDAIDGWVRHAFEAGGQAGIDYLANCTARIEANRQNIADYATDRAELWRGLEGVSIFDLDAADTRIDRAVRTLRDEVAA